MAASAAADRWRPIGSRAGLGIKWSHACDINPLCQRVLSELVPPYRPGCIYSDIADKLPPQVAETMSDVCPTKDMTSDEQVQGVSAMQHILLSSSEDIFKRGDSAPCLSCKKRCCFTRGSFTVHGEPLPLRIHWLRP